MQEQNKKMDTTEKSMNIGNICQNKIDIGVCSLSIWIEVSTSALASATYHVGEAL